MNSIDAKIGAVAVALVSTWSTAHADDFRVTIQTTTALSNVQVYNDRLPSILQPKDTPSLSTKLGSVAAGGTLTTLVSTSYGTSTAASNGGNIADFSVLATTSTSGVVVGGATTTSNVDYAFHFGGSGVSQSAAYSAIVAGSLPGVRPLFGSSGQFGNRLFASQQNGTVTGTLFDFDANGAQTRIGTYTVTFVPTAAAVPGPAAALPFALMALRRRKRA